MIYILIGLAFMALGNIAYINYYGELNRKNRKL